MLHRFVFIFITVFFIPVIILSQPRLDSLFNELDVADPSQKVEIFCDISEIYWQRSFDTSLLMATHALNIATEIEDNSLISSALNMIGNAYFLMGDFTGGINRGSRLIDHHYYHVAGQVEFAEERLGLATRSTVPHGDGLNFVLLY